MPGISPIEDRQGLGNVEGEPAPRRERPKVEEPAISENREAQYERSAKDSFSGEDDEVGRGKTGECHKSDRGPDEQVGRAEDHSKGREG